ncbi:MAG: 30S ribosomal protein S27ae [Candidatus Aenigmarchaeota archaeon]|nr:30S ribosomal protein S27ae [Candidatus Aenigmarchaeota archaeon]
MKHKQVLQHKYFTVKEGTVERTRRYCPRCGTSILAQHKNRFSCGKCTYTEFLKAG